MIKNIEKLTQEQKDLMNKTNELHSKIVRNDYKERMEIMKHGFIKMIVYVLY